MYVYQPKNALATQRDDRRALSASWTQTAISHLCVDIRDFLDGAAVARPSVFRAHDAAVGALTELLYELIFRVDDKGRVESCEGVPLHIAACGEGNAQGEWL
jgi:hypothetical protein